MSPRPAKFEHAAILDAAQVLIEARGPAAATVGAIAERLGAPTGSIYHRFDSRNELVAEVWLRAAAAFQAAFFGQLRGPSAFEAGLSAALTMAQRVRRHPGEARILLLHRREDFVSLSCTPRIRRRAEALGAQVSDELRDFTDRICGCHDERATRTVGYAVIGAPFAAVRPNVEARTSPPPYVDMLIETTYRAVINQINGEAERGR